jgi:hypothetical protein
MRILGNEQGMLSFKAMFVLLVLFCVIHVGLKLVPMYITSESMKDEMSIKARFAQTLKDDEIQSALGKRAKELGLPMTAEQFELERNEDTHQMKIRSAWDVDLIFFWGLYERTYHFEPTIEENYARQF